MHPYRTLASVPLIQIPRLSLVAFWLAFVLSCAGSTTNVGGTVGVTPSPGGVAWTVGVNIGINIAKDELPHLKSAIDARGDIGTQARQQIDHALDVAIAGLPVAQTAFNAVAQGAQGASVCLAHNELESAFTGAIQAMQLIRSLGIQLDSMLVATVTAAVGGLASYLDMLYPACASSGAPARHLSAQQQLRAALGGQ